MCQVAVTLTWAAPARHALIGRALYLPEGWAADEERRELAGVPDEITFETKPQLAGDLLQHAHDQGIRAGFVAGDEVYGGRDLRKSIRARGTGYVLAIRSNYAVTLPSGRRLSVKTASNLVQPAMWQRMRTGSATKGAKDYDWAMIGVRPDDTPDGQEDNGHAFLLLRRHRYTGTVSYYLCWSPGPVPLAKLIAVAVARWKIEEDHQQSKQVSGLDSGQVTTWTSWHRWTAICLLAYIFLAVAAAFQRTRDKDAGILGLIPVTIPELLRQLRGTVIPEPRRDRAHRDGWSLWRRRHQYRARQAHQRWQTYADALPNNDLQLPYQRPGTVLNLIVDQVAVPRARGGGCAGSRGGRRRGQGLAQACGPGTGQLWQRGRTARQQQEQRADRPADLLAVAGRP